MKRAIIRSSLFNILFYALTGFMCVALLPTLFLPRRFYMGTVHIFVRNVYFLERTILGLKYEIRGAENLPSHGPYIIAAKHQSAYETLKLHILFKDPAVILKKELLSIPLWGLYLKKSNPIAIDRSTPDTAIQSIHDGAQQMKTLGRPIVIFPQGTRVGTWQTPKERPYKIGVARIQEATDLPIIPMALNAGIFWPRKSWLKSPGTVIFEFLKPIAPGLERKALMDKLEHETESATKSLMNEAREKQLDQRSGMKTSMLTALIIMTALLGLYSFAWFRIAEHIQKEYTVALQDLADSDTPAQEPRVYGYPGKIKLHVPEERLKTEAGTVRIQNVNANGWPVPGLPVIITTGTIEVHNFRWNNPLTFDSLMAVLRYNRDILDIQNSVLTQDNFTISIAGTADLKQEPIPKLDMNIRLSNHQTLLQNLAQLDIIEERIALFMGAGLTSLADESGIVELPVHQKGQKIYAGPLPIMTLPDQKDLKRRAIVPAPEPGLNPVPDPGSAPAPLEPDLDILQAPSP